MSKTLLLEDDLSLVNGLTFAFHKQGYELDVAQTIVGANTLWADGKYDLLVLDVSLPDGTGFEFCKKVRQVSKVPIIFLTARSDNHYIVSGFQNGADDYVVKPFSLEVLHSRILAILRRSTKKEEYRLFCDEITLDKEKLLVFYKQEEVVLSSPEYQLLLTLMENKGKTITRKQLLEQIWDNNGNYVNDNTLTVTMKRLREKLHNPNCLKTIRSFGYRMEDTV